MAHFLTTRAADVFVCYRSIAMDLGPRFDVVAPPLENQVVAEYGLVVLAADPDRFAAATKFANSLTLPEWQMRFSAHGFDRLGDMP